MILNSPYISGSLTVTGNITSQGGITISGSITSASYATTSSFATTASYANTSTSASYALTASFATNFTASNILASNTITAQTLVVQTVTSSIVYSSGSNIFGNQLTDVQQMTGSVKITGSLSLNNITIPTSASLASTYLPLAGGTLTGALSGTSATFSGNVGLGATSSYAKFNISTGDDNQMAIGTTSVGQTVGIYLADGPTTSSVGYKWEFGKNTSNNFFIYSYGTAANALLINYSTGAATFSSTVKVGGASGGDSLVSTANAGTNPAAFSFVNTGGTSYIGAESSGGGSLVTGDTGYDLVVRGPSGITFSANNGASPNMRITSGGQTLIKAQAAAISGYGTMVQSLLVDGNVGDAAITINALADYAYLNFSQASVTKFEIGCEGAATNKGSLYFNPNIQAGSTGASLYLVKSSGNVLIGTTTDNGYKLNCNGQPGANGYTAWTNYSDSRLKENVTDLDATNALDKICAIRPVTYNYNELSGFDEDTRARRISGFIAQELIEVFPDMVGTIKKDDVEYYDTNLSNLNLYLVKAIQEQQAIITSLQDRLTKAGL